MLKNFIKISLRNLLKNKIFSLVNILGLSIGISCVIIVLLYLKNELTYDNMHADKERIYRVGFNLTMPKSVVKSAVITAAVAPSLKEEFPEVESMVRVQYPEDGFFIYQEKSYDARKVSFADSSFFDVFSFKLLSGNNQNVLKTPYTIVLTEYLSEKIFGDEDPVGKVINWNNEYNLVVSGIAENCPQNSSIQFNALISFVTLYDRPDMYMDWNGGNQYYNYIKLSKNASLESLKAKLPDFLEKHINYMYRPRGWMIGLLFDRMDRLHLHSEVVYEHTRGDISKLRIIGLIGFLILLIAVFNFINLSTAQSSQRSVEIGIRKVVGANRLNIAKYFLSESVIISLIAFVISLILIEIFQPQLSLFIENYDLYTSSNLFFILLLIALSVLIGILAGLYPAFFISRFKPVMSLKGESLGRKKPYLRNSLVLIQFAISTVIIGYTLILIMQMNYVSKKDLSFNTKNQIIIEMPSVQARNSFKTLKHELSLLAEVKKVSVGSNIIGTGVYQNGYLPEGLESPKLFKFTSFEEDMFDILDLRFVHGRAFSSGYALDDSAYIINETFAKEMGWDDPIGKKIYRNGKMTVIGVVKDFHFENVQNEIRPLIIGFSSAETDYYNYVFVELNIDNYALAINDIENVWRKILPNEPFEYQVYDEALKRNYDLLRKSIRVMGLFAVMAVFIACMGLYGLAIFTVDRRKKEIGTRKIFGAGSISIARLVLTDFIKWIVLANILSWPIVYYYAEKFLQTYAFSIKITATPFLVTLFISIVIAFLTVASQIIKLNRTNPIETIKYE